MKLKEMGLVIGIALVITSLIFVAQRVIDPTHALTLPEFLFAQGLSLIILIISAGLAMLAGSWTRK